MNFSAISAASDAPDPQADSGAKLNASAKLLRVLEAVADPSGPHRLSTLVERTGLAKTSVYRLLTELIENGYVARDANGRYRGATALNVLAAKVAGGEGQKTINSFLKRLQDDVGNTIHFALRAGDRAVYIDKVEGTDQPFRMASRPGNELALHSTAIGKAVLAHLSEQEVRGYAARTRLPASTNKTITEVGALLADGAEVREQGYSIDDEENEKMIRCIAAPVFNRAHEPVGGISISTVAAFVSDDQLLSYAPKLIATSALVTDALDI